jgi:hypothetical protein
MTPRSQAGKETERAEGHEKNRRGDSYEQRIADIRFGDCDNDQSDDEQGQQDPHHDERNQLIGESAQ